MEGPEILEHPKRKKVVDRGLRRTLYPKICMERSYVPSLEVVERASRDGPVSDTKVVWRGNNLSQLRTLALQHCHPLLNSR